MLYKTASFSLALFVAQSTASYLGCPPDGPLLPRPTGLGSSVVLQNATRQLQKTIDQALVGQIRAGWPVENTSFSIGLISADSPAPIWSYHQLGSGNTNGTKHIDGDTQYLVGSISKLITDLLVLRTGIDLDTSITQYLPKLLNDTSVIEWGNITLSALADHLSGIPPNSGFSEWYFLQPLLLQLGFPELSSNDYAECGINGLNSPCSQSELLEGMLTAHPVTMPYQRPAYSQLSFTLLSYALSAAYNKTYAELLDDFVFQPFGLRNTDASPGNSSRVAIPPGDSSWGSDYGGSAPGGGLFSSLNDLSVIIHSILNGTALNTASEVREWLKPHSTTSSLHSLVGRPWEIFRATNLTPTYPHTIDIYSKNGGAYGYAAQLAVIDQYGIGLAILTAGPADAYRILYDAMLSVILPAVEQETRLQAQKYVGSFTSNDDLVELRTSIDDGPGIKLSSLARNSSDILAAFPQLFTQALPQFGTLSSDFRIFPAEFSEASTLVIDGVETQVIREDWRINLDFEPNTVQSSGSELPGQGAVKDACVAWQTADWFYYGGEAIDRIVFLKGKELGEVLGVEVPFLRVRLMTGV